MLCVCFANAAQVQQARVFIIPGARVVTVEQTSQVKRIIQLGAFSAKSTDAATATVFLYIYIDKEKQYSNRSKNQRNTHKDCPRWNSA
jgi:hypothetical protein